METMYEGQCAQGHRYTPESTRVLVRPGKTLKRRCRTCENTGQRVRRLRGDVPGPQNSAAPDHVIQHWKDVAEGGQEALVKEVSTMLDDKAGPYAVGVMPDEVFWAKFREAFAGRSLPFGG